MWSSYDGCFKLLDFGLTFHTDETDLHQIQSSGNSYVISFIISTARLNPILQMFLKLFT